MGDFVVVVVVVVVEEVEELVVTAWVAANKSAVKLTYISLFVRIILEKTRRSFLLKIFDEIKNNASFSKKIIKNTV